MRRLRKGSYRMRDPGGNGLPVKPGSRTQLDLRSLCQRQRVFNIDAQVADRIFDLAMAKQQLDGA